MNEIFQMVIGKVISKCLSQKRSCEHQLEIKMLISFEIVSLDGFREKKRWYILISILLIMNILIMNVK